MYTRNELLMQSIICMITREICHDDTDLMIELTHYYTERAKKFLATESGQESATMLMAMFEKGYVKDGGTDTNNS